ncbi:GroES-like protein [Clavulina sp. PMI_390]|nr:GroES-like protein [Clavulina sp. PMI_390]
MSSETGLDIPSVQRALILSSFPGTPVVLERPVPQEVADGEILIKVQTAALNSLDARLATLPWAVLSRMMRLPVDGEKPIVMGFEFSGDVIMIGNNVHTLKVGDRVCAQGQIGSDDASGYQQYVKIPALAAIKVPEKFPYDHAATLPVGFSTAASGIYQAAGLCVPWVEGGEGKYVGQAAVVLGGSSVVGQFAIQLMKLSGFSPIIATSSAQHADFLKSLGATHVVAHTSPAAEMTSLASGKPITAAILAITTLDHIKTATEVLAANAPVAPSGTSPILNISRPAAFLQTATELSAAASCSPPIQVSVMLGTPYLPGPGISAFFVEAYAALQGYLGDESKITACRPKVLEGGLGAVAGKDGFGAFESGSVSGFKLVTHPHTKIY